MPARLPAVPARQAPVRVRVHQAHRVLAALLHLPALHLPALAHQAVHRALADHQVLRVLQAHLAVRPQALMQLPLR